MTGPPTSERSHREVGLSDRRAVELYRQMLLTRALDERIWALNRQGRVGITAPCSGHEACQLGCISAFEPERDVLVPYYRDLGMLVGLGFEPRVLLLDALGKADGPFTGGRQMPLHWGWRRPRILTGSSCVATQLPHAVGAALANRLRGEQAVTLVCFGDGATSKSDFHQALSSASLWKLPVVFFCENNQYAISVPASKQMALPRVADRAEAYGLAGSSVDGNDLLAVREAASQAFRHCRAGGGPYLLEARTYRLLPHTSNDEDSRYRPASEVEEWRARDPLPRYRAYLEAAGLLDPSRVERLAAEVADEVERATAQALAAPEPDPATALDHLYAPGTLGAPRLCPGRARPTGPDRPDGREPIRSEITV
jgi:2-oxoisovalerate dehydrogenase E1 component alpha subunit